MLITRVSILTGIERTIDIDATKEQIIDWEKGNGLVQDIFPDLTADEREFIISGITLDEWNENIQEEEENYL
jgi:hypothetical protein